MTVVPATLRDMSYVLYNLNPADEEETACQVDKHLRRDQLAYALLMSGDNWAVRHKDQPIAVFGTAPINRATLSVWALGTKQMPRALPQIGRYLTDIHCPDMARHGYRYMEARSHANHALAHRWLRWWGAKQHGGPFEFGVNREEFLLFRWSADDLPAVRALRLVRN